MPAPKMLLFSQFFFQVLSFYFFLSLSRGGGGGMEWKGKSFLCVFFGDVFRVFYCLMYRQ